MVEIFPVKKIKYFYRPRTLHFKVLLFIYIYISNIQNYSKVSQIYCIKTDSITNNQAEVLPNTK